MKKPYFLLSPELTDGQNATVSDDVDAVVQAVRDWLIEFREEVGEHFSIDVVELDPETVESLPDI